MNTPQRRHKFWLILPFLGFFLLLVIISLLKVKGREENLARSESREWLDKLLKERMN